MILRRGFENVFFTTGLLTFGLVTLTGVLFLIPLKKPGAAWAELIVPMVEAMVAAIPKAMSDFFNFIKFSLHEFVNNRETIPLFLHLVFFNDSCNTHAKNKMRV
jgi:hypothetical protein